MRVSLLTLGCKVNQAEMSEVESSLKAQGHEIVGLTENPDLCVINTCTVTSKSDYQSRQLIRRAGRTGARVIVTGCYSELNRDEVGLMDGVETVVANLNKAQLINIIDSKSESRLSGLKPGRTRYFLKVQDGCNNSCSYCIVHVARGPSRSVTPGIIIDNIKRAVESGFQEVVLTGIHLGQYGCDLPGGMTVSALVAEILEKTDVKRLRLSSLEVNEIDDNLLSLFKNKRLMPHLHIPLQSGDDTVLRHMKRGYDTATFREALMKVREALPHAGIGTDIIAGFPSETEEAFLNTCSLAESLPVTYIHVFPYSARPGTPAAHMKDLVGDAERKRRASVLRDISSRKKVMFQKGQICRDLEVLFEEKLDSNLYRGTSCNYLKITVHSTEDILGNVVLARIIGRRDDGLYGEAVKNVELPN